jgi:hypothetical protein
MGQQAIRQAEGQAIGQALGGPLGAIVGKARNVVTRQMPGFRPDIATRFYRAVLDESGAPVVSLTPARVGESRAAELLENFGRPALKGGERFEFSDKLQQLAIMEEGAKMASGKAQPIIIPPKPGSTPARFTPTTISKYATAGRELTTDKQMRAGAGLQTAISEARNRFMKEGQTRMGDMLEAANMKGVTVSRRVMQEDGTAKIVQEPLQRAHARTIQLGKNMRELGLQADKNPEFRNQYRQAVKRYSRARTAIEKDLEKQSPEIKAIWDDSMEFWRKGARLYYSRPVGAVKGFGDTGAQPEEVVDLLVRGKLPSEKIMTPTGERMKFQSELIGRIKEAADSPAAWEKVQEAARYGLIDQSTNPQGWIVGNDLTHLLTQRGPELQEVLGKESYENFKTFAEQLEFMQRKRPDIGRIFVQLGQVSATVNIAQGNVTWMRAALVGVPQLISRVLTDPKGFKMLTEGLKKVDQSKTIATDVAQYFPPRFMSLLADEWLELAAETDIDNHEVEEDDPQGGVIPQPPARMGGAGPAGAQFGSRGGPGPVGAR